MQIRKAERIERFLTAVAAAVIAALVVVILLLFVVPPVDRDALTHHLAVPNFIRTQWMN